MQSGKNKYTLRELGEHNKELWNNSMFCNDFKKQYGINELIIALIREKQSGNDIDIKGRINVTPQELEELKKIKSDEKRNFPLRIEIGKVNELTSQNLTELEQEFCIDGIKIRAENIPPYTYSVQNYKKIMGAIDDIKKKVFVHEKMPKNLREPFIALQVINQLAEMIQYDFEVLNDTQNNSNSRYSQACSMEGLITGLAVCVGYSNIAKNTLACFGIESEILKSTTHAWNQVKLNNEWYNLDLTFARKSLLEGKESAYIFMNDDLFYGETRRFNFEGKNGMVETVSCGGHTKNARGHDCPNMLIEFNKNQVRPSRIIEEFKKIRETFEKTGSCNGWQTYEQYEKKKEIKIGGESHGDR